MKAENDFPHAETIREEAATVLGYLNFSSGSEDLNFLAALNSLFAELTGVIGEGTSGEPTWRRLYAALKDELDYQTNVSSAFAKSEQARAALDVVFQHVLPGYRKFHRDLLAHQNDVALFQPFFIGRVFEAVLREGGPFDEIDRVVSGALARLNDYVGYRPIAVLHGSQKMKPYAHERHRPTPIYIRGVGASAGRYHDLIEKAISLLTEVPDEILGSAWFDPDNLDELALDMRAYDFEHPVHRRPNYMFGHWDPAVIDNRGYYRRFILQQVTLDAIVQWYESRVSGKMRREEALFEAAAVIVGTLLMGSGVSGDGPEAHDSETSLGGLLQEIAAYRDALYEHWLREIPGEHGERLRSEASQLHQPFGGVRQSLNQQLAQQRTEQLQRVRIAAIYARLGHAEAATELAGSVAVPSARFECQIMCALSGIQKCLDRDRLDEAADAIPRIRDDLTRGIECGAIVDPWNILGFDAHFSLFPSPENSIHDERVDDLIDMVDAIFSAMTDIEKQAVAAGRDDLRERVAAAHKQLAEWWDRFATTEVSEVEGLSGMASYESAEHVTGAMREWYQAGVGAGDVAFWSRYVDSFETAEAHAVVVDALLDQNDPVASMALLMQWLSRHEEVPLVEGYNSFHKAAMRWMEEVWRTVHEPKETRSYTVEEKRERLETAWALTKKFFDYLEAGSEELWEVPALDLAAVGATEGEPETEEEEDEGSLFDAAYEDVVYRDSTDDGIDAEMVEGGAGLDDFELTAEADRVSRRLSFLRMLAYLWRLAATASMEIASEERREVLEGWARRAEENRRNLLKLLATIGRYRISAPRVPTDEMMSEYDKRQALKEQFLDRAIQACIDTSDVARVIRAAAGIVEEAAAEAWEKPAGHILQALFVSDASGVRRHWRNFLSSVRKEPLLYQATSRGGSPAKVVSARTLLQTLCRFLTYLPRIGLLRETCQLLQTIQVMERDHPAGAGAITEFHEMFEIGYQAIIRCAVTSFRELGQDEADVSTLIRCLERITEPLIYSWVTHGRNTRLSPLEAIRSENDWKRLTKFIEDYGGDLFTQAFLSFGNVRAILHQGVADYLTHLADEAEEPVPHLIEELGNRVSMQGATKWLNITLEAVLDNYLEYVDYNSSTTQSDRGEYLYMFLDFLRVLSDYDRVAWNIQPIVLAHEVLIREGEMEAAESWRKEVGKRTADVAGNLQRRYRRLSKKYGIKLSSIEARLGERFTEPMAVERLRSLLKPAADEIEENGPGPAFERLDKDIRSWLDRSLGVGFDVPEWIQTLEDEIDRIVSHAPIPQGRMEPYPDVPQTPVPWNSLVDEIRDSGIMP